MRDTYNIIPITLALLLHVLVFGSLFVAFDLSSRAQPLTPLAISATLVTESAVVVPPPVEEEPEPEPIPEPEPEPEPEPVEPDETEQERIRLEEEALRQEAERERQRLQQIEDAKREAERRRQEELEKQRREEELERKRREAEEERQREIERQREENRLEQERIERERRQEEIAAEAERLEAMNSNEMLAYVSAIGQKVRRNWIRPGTAPDNLECVVAVQQLPNGEVISVQVRRCNGDDVVVRSIEAAVRKASPLPLPDNPILFDRNLEFHFRIED